MGKYNFNYERVQRLEKENADLKQRLEALEKMLIKTAPVKRDVVSQLNPENYYKVFGIEIDGNGKLHKTTNLTITNDIYTPLYANVARLITPKPYMPPNSSTGKYRLAHKRLEEMTAEEYNIIVEVMQSVTDTLAYAKDKLDKLTEGKDSE